MCCSSDLCKFWQRSNLCKDLDLWIFCQVVNLFFIGIPWQVVFVSYVGVQKMGDPWLMSSMPANDDLVWILKKTFNGNQVPVVIHEQLPTKWKKSGLKERVCIHKAHEAQVPTCKHSLPIIHAQHPFSVSSLKHQHYKYCNS
jgi:hypothetical protein